MVRARRPGAKPRKRGKPSKRDRVNWRDRTREAVFSLVSLEPGEARSPGLGFFVKRGREHMLTNRPLVWEG